MTDLISPAPKLQFFDSNGAPLSGGLLFTYAAGTTTKQNAYTDASGATPNANPIVLDSRGECDCWLSPAQAYKFTLAPSTDTDPPSNPIWTVDNVPSGLSGYSITAAPNIVVSPTGNPTGGSVPPTLSSLNIQVNAASATDREFALCVGVTSAIGGTTTFADKVSGYFGMVGNSGSHDIWALNSVTQISAGAFAANSFNSQGYELDFNNLCQDMGNAAAGAGFTAPIAAGLSVTGASTFKSTAAILISGNTGQWNRGIAFANSSISQAAIQDLCNSTVSYSMFGTHTIGIDMSDASCTYATSISNGNGHYGLDSGGIQRAFVHSSLNTMLIGDAGWSGLYTANTLLPGSNGLDIGSSGSQFDSVFCVSLVQSSNPALKTDIVDAPSMLDIATALPVKTFRWRRGGVDAIEMEELQDAHDTEEVSWEDDETYVDDAGVARQRTVTKTTRQHLYDRMPVLDGNGRQVVKIIPAKRPVFDAVGKEVTPGQAEMKIPQFHEQPRIVKKAVKVRKLVPREGKRTHLGALAPDIQQAFQASGVDFAAYKEDGEFQGYQVDQIVWLTLKALQEEIAARKAIEVRLALLESGTEGEAAHV